MTRFEKEISGSLGEFWKKHAEGEVKRAVERADELGIVEADGAIRWRSNGAYLMDDFCEMLEYAGYKFSREATAKRRDAQDDEFLREYREQEHTPSAEELAEMRSAFGPGAKVVNVLTGTTYTV